MYKILILFLFSTMLNAGWNITYKESKETSIDLNRFNLITLKENIKENINIDIDEDLYITISINKIKTKERAKKIIKILKDFFYDDNYLLKEVIYSKKSKESNNNIVKEPIVLNNNRKCFEEFSKQEVKNKQSNKRNTKSNYKIIIEFNNDDKSLKSFETSGFRSVNLHYEIEEFKEMK